MQFDKAKILNESTSEEQKKNCEHSYEKEYYLGAATDDYVCNKCGNILLRSEYLKWRNEKSKTEGTSK